MPQTPKLYAKAILRVLRKSDGVVVGYVYRWNTGERQIMWLDHNEPDGDVILEDESDRDP